jgi:hypothetical protein
MPIENKINGRFEKINSQGKHQGEYNIDGQKTKNADPSKSHNLRVK